MNLQFNNKEIFLSICERVQVMLDYFVFWATFSLFFQGNIRMLYTYLVPTYRILINSKFDISYKIDNFLQYHFFKDKKLITTNCLSTYLVLENPSYQ